MKRRRLLQAGAACCAAALGTSFAQAPDYAAPERLGRPDTGTDEGGLWALMDREERNLRRSPFLIRDAELKTYLQDLACRLGGDHCPDIRVHLVRTPLFNANMAPNGMMQIWTGLLLRVENEAQLAAVIGHEIGHYLQRHSVDRLRDIKAKSAFGQFLGLFGLVGAVGQIAVLASAFAYGREHEREADRIGAVLMHRAGYDVMEASKVWNNLLEETKARTGKEPGQTSPLFATHPPSPERRETLAEYARNLPGGDKGDEAYRRQTVRFIDTWLEDEVKRGQHNESLVLLTRLLERPDVAPLVRAQRGEVYRLRGEAGDQERALEDYRIALQASQPLPSAWRGIGLVTRQRGERDTAIQAFDHYLELSPEAPDAGFIKHYLAELKS